MAHSADGVPSKLPKGVDASTFFSPVIPDDIRSSFKLLHEHPAEVYAPFVKVVAQYLAEGDGMMIPTALYDRTESATGMSTNDINMLLSAIFLIVRSAIRSKSKVSVVRRDLAETMLLPAQFVEQICAALVKFRTPLERHVLVNRIHHAKLEKIRWRLDVTISSGSLSRIMRPNILMQLILKDGRVKTFEVSIEQFNQLRYNVAKVLHHIQTLERHPIMRIINEFKRREEEDYNN